MDSMLNFLILAVHKGSEATGPVVKSLSLPWGIVGFLTILGLIVTLSPARRTSEVKKPKED